MVAPIVGPTVKVDFLDIDQEGSYRRAQTCWKQKLPYDRALPYKLRHAKTLSAERWGFTSSFGNLANANAGHGPWWVSSNYTEMTEQPVQALISTARSRFSGKASESAEVLVNLAERKQAMVMITNRLGQLFRAVSALKRRDVKSLLRELGLTQDPRALRRAGAIRAGVKQWSNIWLELWFGWVPLVKDIWSATQLLDSPLPLTPIKGRAKERIVFTEGGYQNFGEWGVTQRADHQVVLQVQVGGALRLENPNLYLAARLGLTNPATVVWELVPWSFVVDWFVNVGDYLKQFTEFGGVEFVMPYHFFKATAKCTYLIHGSSDPDVPSGMRISSQKVSFERVVGIPDVNLGVRPPWRLSPTRALTAASLLIQKGIRA